jgi:hypothetical protein
LDSFFHWLAQPYHMPDGFHANGAFLGYSLVLIAFGWLEGYVQGRGHRK